MSDILKEAIADAKAVRETALQNAKMALEEAFTPQLKSMLSAKLKEDEMEDEVPMDDEMGDEEEIPAEEGYYEDEAMGEEEPEMGEEEPAAFEDEEMGDEEGGFGDEEEMEDESLDLEAVIRELETELKEEDEAYDEKASSADKNDGKKSSDLAEGEGDDDEVEVDESIFNEEDEDEEAEELEEVDKSSGIGKGDNSNSDTDKSSGIGNSDNSLSEVKAQLAEYKEAVVFLKDKLHEVNILNAKLLFTNKLFKEFTLNNNQKLKVVETFDRAQTTREIKLVYSTLAEQFGDNGSIARKKSINESASSKAGSTKPSKGSRKVITEEQQVANRFRKLAGLIK